MARYLYSELAALVQARRNCADLHEHPATFSPDGLRDEAFGERCHVVMATNNAYDSILLVGENDMVLSAWTADKQTIYDFIRDGKNADNWNAGEWSTFSNPAGEENEDELRTIAAYGDECGRDGVIADSRRREFWMPEEYASKQIENSLNNR